MRYHVNYYQIGTNNMFGSGDIGFLPRIGEHVRLRGLKYKVVDIVYELINGSTQGVNVEIYVE